MALSLSTQTSPFKPLFPSLLWFSTSCLRSSSMASRSSLHFWASPRKVLIRQGDCGPNVACPISNRVVCSSSFQCKRGSSFSTMSFDENYKQDDMELYRPSSRWKLEVPKRGSSPSNSFARMRPDHPNQISSKGNSLAGGFDSPTRMGEEKKQGDPQSAASCAARKKLRGTRMASCGNSENSHRNIGIPSRGTTGIIGRSGSEGFQEGSAYGKPNYSLDSCPADYDNNSGERVLQTPFGQGYMSDDQINPQVYGPACKSSSEFDAKSEGITRFVTSSIDDNLVADVGFTGNNHELAQLLVKQYVTIGPQSNAGNGALRRSTGQKHLVNPLIPQTSALPYKPISRKPEYSGNGNRCDSVIKDHDTYKPASSQQYRRKNDMYENIVSGFPHHFPGEQDLSSTQTSPKEIQRKWSSSGELLEEGEEPNSRQLNHNTTNALEKDAANGYVVSKGSTEPTFHPHPRERLLRIYDKVLVVDNISKAREIVRMLTHKYRHRVHACDTEVANIDVKLETPVDHGEIICFSIYSGPEANFGDGKSCIWVDVLDGGGKSLLIEFAPFFEDPKIKKIWHNYSFDKHILENYGLNVSGFHADTMHMARLWDSSRRIKGGYSLEALTCDPVVCCDENLIGKVSMKTIFGRRNVKKNGSEGKIITIPPVEELQREDRKQWICYSALDSMSTLKLYENLKRKLFRMKWKLDGCEKGSMLDFYEKYWRSFGELLVKMETDGMLVDRAFLAEVEKVAREEQEVAANRFRSWASKYCPDAKYMNVGSDAQLRQLFFGGIQNRKDPNESLPQERTFKVLNVEKVIEEGKKTAKKFRNIKLHRLSSEIATEMYTASGWPSVSGDALKALSGKVSPEFDFSDESHQLESDDNIKNLPENKSKGAKVGDVGDGAESACRTAYAAFGEGQEGKEACDAIAALCEICSIDSLISNFILPLQGSHISGKNGRIHCSLNINTETGRLSARRPNLQNQPALEKDRYKIRQAFIAAPGNSLIVADYGQLELRILAHLANCESMLDAFKAGGDFHSRTAMNMYPHIREAVEQKHVLLEWHPQPGEENPPVPLLKDAFGSERRKAKMLNFSIAYGKTPVGLSRDWKVSVKEAKATVDLWYNERKEVQDWQDERKKEARENGCVHTLLGRARQFPSMKHASPYQKGHIERAAINAPVQGSAADVAMCAMLEISKNAHLKELGWRLLLQVHDEVILEGPTESAEAAKAIVVECMSKPFGGRNFLKVDLSVDAKCAQNWYSAK
ncbi:DNA polymerase I A, chloroplastic/mitochondrial-like [Actinidia eriantha]|uniref:DNA polymerase I A, chloroplastic/mitochondrial-like n=1 Tax=Actinidia eriantha TaxID=165200 RepID=UPI0025851DC3|nr:DNA polymerase I A, chloroplastic/mitochondrial-like [Actinidia eriantha]